MTINALDRMKLLVILVGAVCALGGAIVTHVDAAAASVGVVVIMLIVAAGLSHLYRHADRAVAVVGLLGYLILEQNQGSAGWLAVTASGICFAAAAVAVRLLNRQMDTARAREREAAALINELAVHDEVSGLLKPHPGKLNLENEVQRARRTDTYVSLVLIAADTMPDHPVDAPPDPDEEAARVADILRRTLRVTDRGVRLSATQFAAILPATDAQGAGAVAEKLRRYADEYRYGSPLRCAAATFPDTGLSAADLLEEAEAALEFARSGNVAVADPTMLRGGRAAE